MIPSTNWLKDAARRALMGAANRAREDVFRSASVWVDAETELRFYRWAWPFVEPLAEREGALPVAVTLAYFYLELCRTLGGESFIEDLWDTLDEYGIGDREGARERVTAFHPSQPNHEESRGDRASHQEALWRDRSGEACEGQFNLRAVFA